MPFDDGSSNDFRPRVWLPTMLRFTVRCSNTRRCQGAQRACRCPDRYREDVRMEEAFAAIKRAALPKRRLLVPTLNESAGAKHGDLVADPVARSDFFFV